MNKLRIPPMPTELDRMDAWRDLYIGRMVKCGVDIEDARANFESVGFEGAIGHGLHDDPEEAADAEMGCWDVD